MSEAKKSTEKVDTYTVEGMEYGIAVPIPFSVLKRAFKHWLKEEILDAGEAIYQGCKRDADENIEKDGAIYMSVCQNCAITYMTMHENKLKKK